MSIDPDAEALLDRFLLACRLRGVDQTECARRLGTGQSTTQPYFARKKVPGGVILSRAPAALEISGHWLLTGEGTMDPPGASPGLEQVFWQGVQFGLEKAKTVMQGALERIEVTPAEAEASRTASAGAAAQRSAVTRRAGPAPKRPGHRAG